MGLITNSVFFFFFSSGFVLHVGASILKWGLSIDNKAFSVGALGGPWTWM